jgi:hypothetical protein
MKGFRIICMVAVIFLIASAVRADSIIDPRMRIAYGSYSDPAGINFSFTSFPGGGGDFDFYNDSPVDWTSLLIQVPTPTFYDEDSQMYKPILDSDAYTIIDAGGTIPYDEGEFDVYYDHVFLNPIQILVTPDLVSILFSGTSYTSPGIWFGQDFYIALYDVDDYGEDLTTGGWLRNGAPITFYATANATSIPAIPEPKSGLLMLGGIFLLSLHFALRKRRSRIVGKNRH